MVVGWGAGGVEGCVVQAEVWEGERGVRGEVLELLGERVS